MRDAELDTPLTDRPHRKWFARQNSASNFRNFFRRVILCGCAKHDIRSDGLFENSCWEPPQILNENEHEFDDDVAKCFDLSNVRFIDDEEVGMKMIKKVLSTKNHQKKLEIV